MTSDGERWDLLAWLYYGDPTAYSTIVMANPQVPIAPVLDPGVILYIPIVPTTSSPALPLPPWSQAK
jgi:phage tail protein X